MGGTETYKVYAVDVILETPACDRFEVPNIKVLTYRAKGVDLPTDDYYYANGINNFVFYDNKAEFYSSLKDGNRFAKLPSTNRVSYY